MWVRSGGWGVQVHKRAHTSARKRVVGVEFSPRLRNVEFLGFPKENYFVSSRWFEPGGGGGGARRTNTSVQALEGVLRAHAPCIRARASLHKGML